MKKLRVSGAIQLDQPNSEDSSEKLLGTLLQEGFRRVGTKITFDSMGKLITLTWTTEVLESKLDRQIVLTIEYAVGV
jgi:hypothetical protein